MKPIPKHLRMFWSITNRNIKFETDLDKLTKPSADGQYKYLKFTLNSMDPFLLLLVIYCLGSPFKILKTSWYTSMKPFWDNLDRVIKKYLCSLHDSFPGVDSYSNIQVLCGMSRYISSYNYILILFNF